MIPISSLKTMTMEELKEILSSPDSIPTITPSPDGKGVFLSEMDEEEYDKYVYEEERGWKKFINKIFNL